MPTLNDTELVQFKEWTLRIRPASVRPSRLLLMVHGWTGSEDSMWVFARDMPPENWIIAPRAPYPAQPGGYSWRRYDPGTQGRPSLELLQPSIEALVRLVDEYAHSVGVDAARFDVMGFSQGAAMANVLAMLHPERVRRVGVLAGFVPSGAEALVHSRPLAGKKIFVAHGTLDKMVPVDRARASIGLLEQAGAEVAYCEEEIGHKVGAGCLRALRSYLAE
jgi:phospholipase/carboxylesterase